MRIRDILDRQAVCLNASPVSKEDAVSRLVELMANTGRITDMERFRDAVFEREAQSSTGMGEGIAIPHAKSDAVTRPGLATMVVPQGVDFDSFDGEPVHLLFLIASPHQASDAHLDVLARLSKLLMHEDFRQSLLKATTIDEYLAVIDRTEAQVEAQERAEAGEEQVEAEPPAAEEPEDESSLASSAAEVEEQPLESVPSEVQPKAAEVCREEENSSGGMACESAGAKEEPLLIDSAIYSKPKKKVYDLVAVTACPAGLSHTYMAAEALEQKAKEMGLTIKVEADGAAGNRNSLLPEDIASAKAVIVAADRAVNTDRFVGKPLVRTGVVDGVHHPEKLIKKALDPNCPIYKAGSVNESSTVLMRLYRHLMSGLTYILPLAATTGILSAIARMEDVVNTDLGLFLDTIGYSIGTLLFPVLSGFIAFSMAGRMALVGGFTGGIMADMAGSGILGALVNGFVGGAVAFMVARLAQRFLKGHDAMFALLVYPMASAVLTTVIAQFITNIPCALIGEFITDTIGDAHEVALFFIGALLGGMMSADMGGPFNKISYAFGVLMLADCLPENGVGTTVMGAVMLGGMVPPLAAGLTGLLFGRWVYSEEERKASLGAFIKGFLFITEGVIPFLKASPHMRVACILGSASAGAFSMFFHCGVVAPHGGIFIMFLALNPWYYALSLAIGTVIGVSFFVLLHPLQPREKKSQQA